MSHFKLDDLSPSSVSSLLIDTLSRQCADETTTVGKFFSKKGEELIKNALGKTNDAQVLNVSFQLTADQQVKLKRNFPGREVVFSNSSSSSHSFAAAHRLLESDFIYQCFGNKTCRILDLGGNFLSHLKQKRYNVHSCCPLLDVRDGARHTERAMCLDTYLTSHPAERNEVDFCEKRFQDCDINADYAMAIHATSDMPLDVLCGSLKKKGVKKFICSMMIVPEMIVNSRGYLEDFNVNWEIDKEADRIYFDFVDAPCLGYDHKYSTLLQYLHTNVVVVGDAAYRVERKQDFGGVMIIDVTYCAGFKPGMELNAGRSCAWFSSLKSKTMVRVVDIDNVHPVFDLVERRKVIVDTKVITRVAEAAFRQFKPNVDDASAIQTISTFLSSSTNHCIINGVTMIAGVPLHIEDYVPVATTIYARVKKIYGSLSKSLSLLNSGELEKAEDVFPLDESLSPLGRLQVSNDFARGLSETDVRIKLQEGDYDTGASLSRFIGMPVKAIAKELGFLPAKFEKGTNARGQPVKVEAYNSFCKSLKDTLSFQFFGMGDVPSSLLSDPEYFLPLDSVMCSLAEDLNLIKCITVEELHSSLKKKRDDVLSEKIALMEQDEISTMRLHKAIVQVAKWCEAHPDGKIPEGLGGADFIPTFKKEYQNEESFQPYTSEAPILNGFCDSILEAVEYLTSVSAIQRRTLQMLGEHCEWSTKGLSQVFTGDDSRRAYIPNEGRWVGPNKAREPEARYERGMTCDGFVPVYFEKDALKLTDASIADLKKYSVVIFDKSCIFFSDERILPALKQSLHVESNFVVSKVDGVAGCGKTTTIKSMAVLTGDFPDLILTSNSSSATELKETLVGSALVKSRNIRTLDSYLMAKNKPQARRILFDECFMSHAGCVYAAATLSGCEEVIGVGDSEQIPFISRNDLFTLQHHKLEGASTFNNITYRSPADACYALSKYCYKKKKPKTKSRVIRSVSLTKISHVGAIPVEPDSLYICHNQADKLNLKSRPEFRSVNVKTTHEAQGMTYGKVIYFRLTRTSSHLFTGKHPIMGCCHNLVAMSRHKTAFHYYTMAGEDSSDMMLKMCEDVLTGDDNLFLSYKA